MLVKMWIDNGLLSTGDTNDHSDTLDRQDDEDTIRIVNGSIVVLQSHGVRR